VGDFLNLPYFEVQNPPQPPLALSF